MDAQRRLGLTHLVVLYLVWGSTYAAIRVAVAPGGFAPMWMGALRMATAGCLLLVFARLRGHRILPEADAVLSLAISGLMIWAAGNGLVMVAELEVPSSVAALVAATTPGWVTLVESVLDRRLPSRRTALALTLGLVGVLALQSDPSMAGVRPGPLAALVFSALCFAAGTVAHKRFPVRGPASVRAGWEQLLATTGFITLALARGESFVIPGADAWLGFSYLVVFGSVIAFTSFVTATEMLPTSLVSTHAFVNPVVAVALGWLFLDEAVTLGVAVAAAFIVASVCVTLLEPHRMPIAGSPVLDHPPLESNPRTATSLK